MPLLTYSMRGADNSLRIVAPAGPYRLQDLLARPVQRASRVSLSHPPRRQLLWARCVATLKHVHDELDTWPSCRRERERGEERAFGIHGRRDCSDHERQARPAGRTSGQHDGLPRGSEGSQDLPKTIGKNYRKINYRKKL